MVIKARKCFGFLLLMEIGVTQGGPVSPTIFNIILDAMVRAVIMKVCGPQEAHHSFGCLTGEHNFFF